MLEKTVRINYLYDFYQVLLTPKQRQYMNLYYLKDYSLGEIAENAQVSRQAVYDNIKRTETMLESYEKALRLYDKFMQRISITDELEKNIIDKDMEQAKKCIKQLKELD